MSARRLKIGNYARVSYDEDKERYESIINQRIISSRKKVGNGKLIVCKIVTRSLVSYRRWLLEEWWQKSNSIDWGMKEPKK